VSNLGRVAAECGKELHGRVRWLADQQRAQEMTLTDTAGLTGSRRIESTLQSRPGSRGERGTSAHWGSRRGLTIADVDSDSGECTAVEATAGGTRRGEICAERSWGKG
jgi:hypothetical protein